ncbi:MAG: hypothetical protein IPJ74_16470 [Saprospiraceae bacterium]|nr:hypothetical protein [Saprospiraceae bacterium]
MSETRYRTNVTDGTGYMTALDITGIDYGGGYYWAIMPLKPGGIPCLQFPKVTTPPLTWKAFAGNVMQITFF